MARGFLYADERFLTGKENGQPIATLPMPLTRAAARARPRALRDLLHALPRPDGQRPRHGRAARLPPAALLPHRPPARGRPWATSSTSRPTASARCWTTRRRSRRRTAGRSPPTSARSSSRSARRSPTCRRTRAPSLESPGRRAQGRAVPGRHRRLEARRRRGPTDPQAEEGTLSVELNERSARCPEPSAAFARRALGVGVVVLVGSRRGRHRATRPVLPLLPAGVRLLERPRRRVAGGADAPVPDGRRLGHRDPPRARGGDAHASADGARVPAAASSACTASTSGRTPTPSRTTSCCRRRRST